MTEAGEFDRFDPSDFLELVRDLEDETETKTVSSIPKMGSKLPICYELVGEVLYFLDAMGSCMGSCDPELHDVSYLSGKASSYGRSSLRLFQIGHYEGSLLLTRSIGEIANLLTLFVLDETALGEWRSGQGNFSPVKVRIRLEESVDISVPVGIDQFTYRELSGRSAHVDRDQSGPNAYNTLGLPTTGGRFQEAGLMICINELSKAIAYSCWASGMLLGREIELHRYSTRKGLALLENLGGMDLAGFAEYVKSMKNTPEGNSMLEISLLEAYANQKRFQSRWRAGESHKEADG